MKRLKKCSVSSFFLLSALLFQFQPAQACEDHKAKKSTSFSNEKPSSEVLARSKMADLKVKGMVCSSCSDQVSSVLKKIKGILSAQITIKENRVRITYDPTQVTPDTMVQAIKNIGHEVEVL